MLYISSGFLLFFLKPIVWVILIFIFAIFCKGKTTRKRLLIVGLLSLLFFSNPYIIGKVYNAYEADYPRLQHYQVGIVLGGFSGYEKSKQIIFNSSADRFFKTIDLYHQKKIERILISGGNSNLFDNKIKEADLAAAHLRKLGIPDSVILVENQSRNTIENAAFSFKKINEINPKFKVLVITSAWHIPRARLDFSKYFKGDISYYPSNYIGKTSYNLTDYLRPSFSSFFKWNLIVKEWVGLFVDRFRG